jgi:sugar phosphate isomerase/epimerase
MADYKIDNIYQGGYSSLKPSYGDIFTGYHISAGEFGLTTDPRIANVLQEVSSKLSTGVKHIEVEGLQPDVFESMPNDQLKEVARLAKLTGIKVSLHGPLVEASGFSKDGYSDTNRKAAEIQMMSAIERAHDLNPDGSSPVTFHSSVMLPTEIIPKGKEIPEETLVINVSTGAIVRRPLKKGFFPGKDEIDIQTEIKKMNEETWSSDLTNLGYATERAGEFISDSGLLKYGKEAEEKAGKPISLNEKRAEQMYNIGENYLKDSYRRLKDLYDIAYRYGTNEDKKRLDELRENISEKVNEMENVADNGKKIYLRQEIIGDGLKTLSKISAPDLFKPLNEFAKEKTIETFGDVAFHSYDKFKDKAPIISIENPPYGGAFSRADELKEIVERARIKFVEKAVNNGLSKSEAKKEAEKLIGVTWDVGHINMLRKYGYESEDIVKETEKIKPLVKHVHLSDNFGLEHTELPMGMGNVPIKEIMEKLGKEGFEAKKIIEAGNWWQHFKSPPVKENLEAFGSPIYSDGVAPFWNQTTGLYQGYFGGMGLILPQINYETFGAGFAQLPVELGGQRPGAAGSRMSGRGME